MQHRKSHLAATSRPSKNPSTTGITAGRRWSAPGLEDTSGQLSVDGADFVEKARGIVNRQIKRHGLTWRFLAVVATQGSLIWIREAYREAMCEGVRRRVSSPSLPVSVFRRSSRFNVVRPRGSPTPAWPGWDLRSGRSTLSSPQRAEGTAATRGLMAGPRSPKRNVLWRRFAMVSRLLSREPLSVNASRRRPGRGPSSMGPARFG